MHPGSSTRLSENPTDAADEASAIRIRGVVKAFGAMTAVDELDLDIRQGEFFSMLGPSGSGKTTVLRLIAGFELPSAGTIHLHGREVTNRAPFERDVNTVFQDYALFPHMTVLDNVAYGLRVRGVGKKERRARAEQALSRVQLSALLERKPAQLSGGQRQRVALARALVVEPKVLLLDEPLGALDLKLRQQMQVELKELQRSLGITFILVTHDQEEALTMSDRIGVINAGKLVQLGTPGEIYRRPNGRFVANFVGTSNFFGPAFGVKFYNRSASFCLRPQQLRIGGSTPEAGQHTAPGVVSSTAYLGYAMHVHVHLDDGTPIVVLGDVTDCDDSQPQPGTPVNVTWNDSDVVWLPADAAGATRQKDEM